MYTNKYLVVVNAHLVVSTQPCPHTGYPIFLFQLCSYTINPNTMTCVTGKPNIAEAELDVSASGVLINVMIYNLSIDL